MLCLCTIITFDVTLLINISITLACKYTRTYVLVIVFATGSDVILFINPCFFFLAICLYVHHIYDVEMMYRSTESSTTFLDPTHRSSILSVFRLMLCVRCIGMQTDALNLIISISINSLSAIGTRLLIPEFNP